MKRLLFLVSASLAFAHVGSPDIFLEGSAGPYPLFVTIRPPTVIPGVAEIEIRCSSPDLSQIRVTPTPMTGAGAKFAPTPDVMQRSNLDAQFFTGSLWMMAPGSWEVHVQAEGSKGSGELAVPVPALATQTKPMQKTMAAILLVLMFVLVAGIVSIVGASAREAQLEPGMPATARSKSRARVLMGLTAAIVVFILWAGDRWWTAEANGYSTELYKPLGMSVTIDPHERMILRIENTTWLRRRIDDFVPDHGHLMHLYVIAQPDANRVWHLHPEMTGSGEFSQDLPPMPAGRYKLYGDVVHSDGLGETLVADLNIPQDLAGNPLRGDDAAGVRGQSPDGAHIEWIQNAAPIKARQASLFKFRLLGKDNKPVEDAELYMGMLGHAAFLKTDGSVFAHVHPSGSVPMAALAIANPSHSEHMHSMSGLPAEVAFPYGFPSPGNYRIIVQMKHAGTVETGIFDTVVQ